MKTFLFHFTSCLPISVCTLYVYLANKLLTFSNFPLRINKVLFYILSLCCGLLPAVVILFDWQIVISLHLHALHLYHLLTSPALLQLLYFMMAFGIPNQQEQVKN